jgi:hypothetical protein
LNKQTRFKRKTLRDRGRPKRTLWISFDSLDLTERGYSICFECSMDVYWDKDEDTYLHVRPNGIPHVYEYIMVGDGIDFD